MQPTYAGEWTDVTGTNDLGVRRERRPIYMLPQSVGDAAVRDEAVGETEAKRVGTQINQYRLRMKQEGGESVSSPYLFLLGPGSSDRIGDADVIPSLQPISLSENQFLGVGRDIMNPQFWMGDGAYLPELLEALYMEVGHERAEKIFNEVYEDEDMSMSDLYDATATEAALIHVDEAGLDEVPYEIELADDLLGRDIDQYVIGVQVGLEDGVEAFDAMELVGSDDDRINMAPRYVKGNIDIYRDDIASVEQFDGR